MYIYIFIYLSIYLFVYIKDTYTYIFQIFSIFERLLLSLWKVPENVVGWKFGLASLQIQFLQQAAGFCSLKLKPG